MSAEPSENHDPVEADAIVEGDPAALAAMAAEASDEQLAEAMGDAATRKKILDEIFNRMADHVDPAQIKDVEAAIHFKITDAPGGGEDVYEAVFKDGTVTVNDQPTSESPKLAIAAAPVPFLKLVTGQDSGPAMFMAGKLKVEGDLMLASRMTSFFRIPSAA